MKLTGTWPRKERLTPMAREHPEGNWVALATDRHRCGQPIRAVSPDFDHITNEARGKTFQRFRSREDGERWLYENRASLDITAWRYTITTL